MAVVSSTSVLDKRICEGTMSRLATVEGGMKSEGLAKQDRAEEGLISVNIGIVVEQYF